MFTSLQPQGFYGLCLLGLLCLDPNTTQKGLSFQAFTLTSAHLGPSRVRIHDLRTNKIALSLSAHQLGVSAVQMDDWKVVSGGEEGLVSVWDYRMNQKLWEVHSR